MFLDSKNSGYGNALLSLTPCVLHDPPSTATYQQALRKRGVQVLTDNGGAIHVTPSVGEQVDGCIRDLLDRSKSSSGYPAQVPIQALDASQPPNAFCFSNGSRSDDV